MAWIIAGLGNPGEEFIDTRHNTGRMALEFFAKQMKFSEWKEDKKAKAHVSRGMIGKTLVALVNPDTFMNKSGSAVAKFVSAKGGSASGGKNAERLIVVYDDLDLPFGTFKVSFDRGSGGHKGIESIIRALKTKKFVRVRIGVSPSTAGGEIRKPEGEKVVVNFILARFKYHEQDELKQIFKKVSQALETIVASGREIGMNRFN